MRFGNTVSSLSTPDMKGHIVFIAHTTNKTTSLDAGNDHKMHFAAEKELLIREMLLKSHSGMLNREGIGR